MVMRGVRSAGHVDMNRGQRFCLPIPKPTQAVLPQPVTVAGGLLAQASRVIGHSNLRGRTMTDQTLAARVAAMETLLHVAMTLLEERGALRDGDVELIRTSAKHRQRDRIEIPSEEIMQQTRPARRARRVA